MYPNPLQVLVGKFEIVTSYSSFFNIDLDMTTVNLIPYLGVGTFKSFKMVQLMDLKDSIFEM